MAEGIYQGLDSSPTTLWQSSAQGPPGQIVEVLR